MYECTTQPKRWCPPLRLPPIIIIRQSFPFRFQGVCWNTTKRATPEVPLCQRFHHTEHRSNPCRRSKSIYQGLPSAALELIWPPHNAHCHVEATHHNETTLLEYNYSTHQLVIHIYIRERVAPHGIWLGRRERETDRRHHQKIQQQQ